jgi:peroxiredoxin
LSNQVGMEPKPQSHHTWVMFAIVSLFALAALVFALSGVNGARADVGKPAPAFTVVSTQGVEINSLALRGSVVVVNFFASWCKPCQVEAPELESIWTQYRDQGVAFVGIAYEDTEVKINEFVTRYGLTFPVVTTARKVGREFGVTGVPETYVIDREGLVVYKHLGAIDPAELTQMIEHALR